MEDAPFLASLCIVHPARAEGKSLIWVASWGDILSPLFLAWPSDPNFRETTIEKDLLLLYNRGETPSAVKQAEDFAKYSKFMSANMLSYLASLV